MKEFGKRTFETLYENGRLTPENVSNIFELFKEKYGVDIIDLCEIDFFQFYLADESSNVDQVVSGFMCDELVKEEYTQDICIQHIVKDAVNVIYEMNPKYSQN